ncbi:ROK family protein [Bacillus sp. FJAT-27251]|uniref:ROK family protein n=1 Tax=Bacillus sp. FJAT-27251 TaxID=1684142 RepID=UPI0006A768A4|nr:ROK family protein [Bacillus sp. FJAT-27251]
MLRQLLIDTTPKGQILLNIFKLVHQMGPICKADLLSHTSLKLSTLSRNVDELVRRGVLRESGIAEIDRGRPPVLYEIDRKCGFIIGISITRTNTSIVLLDLHYHPVEHESFVMTSLHTPDFVLSKIENIIENFLIRNGLEIDQLLGIGIASVGKLDKENGVIVKHGDSYLDWIDIPVVERLKKKFAVKILLENVPNAALLGEYRYSKPLEKNILYWIIGGWGIGCGIMTDGQILDSKQVDIDGYNHMIIDINGRQCSCGRKGCLITYASPYHIFELQKRDSSINFNPDKLSTVPIHDLMEFLKQGDRLTDKIVMESAHYLGVGISNIANIFQSEMIIINGPLPDQYPNFFNRMQETIVDNLIQDKKIKFSQGALKKDATAIGAAMYILDSYLSND